MDGTAKLATYVPQVLLGLDDVRPRAWEAEGTLVFADVSGFTRLTERLSKQGKIGAEQIVVAISRVWTALLTASADGGDVLKFGGDALLLLYQGDRHAEHAVHAALAMQRALRHAGRVETPSGAVRLRMSVGVHSGRMPLLVCGGDHLELFVVGPVATTLVETEAAADAGQVLVSATTAAHLGLEPRPQVVRRVPSPGDRVADPSPPVDPAPFVPPPLRARLAGHTEEHEHRRATVGFLHVGAVDQLLARAGVAAVFEQLQEVTCRVMQTCATRGVLLTCTDVGADGVKFMLTAGAPEASEDDAGRMLRVMHDIVSVPLPDLTQRAGVNTGNVFTGVVGAPFRRTYSTMGDATNLAARTMGKAPWGHVLATRTSLDDARTAFEVEPVPPLVVKGKSAPVPAALVVAPRSSEWSDAAVVTPPLVGRSNHLRRLVGGLTDVRAGRGRLLELVGDAGSGKSRLVAELRTRAKDVRWASVACQPLDRATPWHAARVLLRRALGLPLEDEDATAQLVALVDRTRPDLRPWLPLVAVPLGLHVPSTPEAAEILPQFREDRTRAAITDLLVHACAGPTVFVVEDAGALDDASASLLAHVVREALPTRPWLLVATRRPDRDASTIFTVSENDAIDVGPLGDADARRLVAHLCERAPVPVHLQEEIVRQGAGNPLFLVQLVLSRAAGDAGELPPSVEAIVATRIDALAQEDRLALRYASVLGSRCDAGLLEPLLADLGLDPRRLAHPRRFAGLLVADGTTYRFPSELVREVAYEGLPFRRRRDLHGRVATALQTTARGGAARHDGQLPLHLARAERWEEAWRVACTSAEAARTDGANATAATLYGLALEAARHLQLPGPEVARVAEAAGDVLELAGLYDSALDAYRRARELAPVDQRPRLAARVGLVHERAGRYTQAVRWHRRGLREVERLGDDHTAARRHQAHLLTGVAAARYRQGRLRECVRTCLAAVPEAERAADDTSLAHLYYLLTGAYTDLGHEADAARFRHLALPLYETTGDLVGQGFVLNNLGVDAYANGEMTESIRLYERARDLLARAGDVVGSAMSSNNIGESLVELGRDDEAEPLFREALRTWRGASYPVGIALACRNLGGVALRRGNVEDAATLLAEACELFSEIGAEAFRAEAETLMAQARALITSTPATPDGTAVPVPAAVSV